MHLAPIFRSWPVRLALILLLAVALRFTVSRWQAPKRLLQLHSSHSIAQERAAPPATLPASRELTLATANLAHGRGPTAGNFNGGSAEERAERLRAIGRLLREHDVDLAVLCEADFDSFWSGGVNQAAIVAEQAGLPCRFSSPTYS